MAYFNFLRIKIFNMSFFLSVKNYFMIAFKKCFAACLKKAPKRYAIWQGNVNKKSPVKFVPTKKRHIYSEHFRLDMFEEGGERVILKSYAVPTIFSHPKVCVYVPSYFIYH